jgi:hypothetical protein
MSCPSAFKGAALKTLRPLPLREDGQRRAGQQPPHRFQVHALALDMALRRRIGDDAAVLRQEIHLHARVHRHQLVEQLAYRLRTQPAGVHQGGAVGDMLGQSAGKALHGFLFAHPVGADLQPCGGGGACQQKQGENQRQALRQAESSHASSPLSADAKR